MSFRTTGVCVRARVLQTLTRNSLCARMAHTDTHTLKRTQTHTHTHRLLARLIDLIRDRGALVALPPPPPQQEEQSRAVDEAFPPWARGLDL